MWAGDDEYISGKRFSRATFLWNMVEEISVAKINLY